MMMTRLDLKPRHREQLATLLAEHMPGVEVWAYGSRVSGKGHEGSDLDLALRGPGLEPVPVDKLSRLTDALRESTLPFLVEVHDWARLPLSFREEIERSYAVLASSEVGPMGNSKETSGRRLAND